MMLSQQIKAVLRMSVMGSPLGSISPTFKEQLLCPQMPKAQKVQSSRQSFFALLR